MRISPYIVPGIPRSEIDSINSSMPHKILIRVADEFDVPIDRMKSRTRKRRVVEARQVGMFILRRRTNLLLREIGDLFGERDHTTVMHSLRTVRDHMYAELDYKERVEKLLEAI